MSAKPDERLLTLIPDSLKGVEVDWSAFQPTGGWDYYVEVTNGVLTEFKRINDELRDKLRRHGEAGRAFKEMKRKSTDLLERFEALMELGKLVCGRNGTTVGKIVRELSNHLVEDAPNKEAFCDFDRWVNTTRSLLSMMGGFTEHALSDIRENEEIRREYERDLRVGEAFEAIHRTAVLDDIYSYAVLKMPLKFKTKFLREQVRILREAKAAVEVINANRNNDIVSKLVANPTMKGAFDEITGRLLKNHSNILRLKKLIDRDGNAVWERHMSFIEDRLNGYYRIANKKGGV